MSLTLQENPQPNNARTLASQLDKSILPNANLAGKLGITLIENHFLGRRTQAIRERLGKPKSWSPLCYHWAFQDESNFDDISRTEPLDTEAPTFQSFVTNNDIIPKLFPSYHPTQKPQAGDVVTYSTSDGKVRHFAIYVSGNEQEQVLVESKWAGGHIWQHPLMVLPTGLGEIVEYYSKK